MPTVRSVVRALGTLIAVLLVAAGSVLAVPAMQASARPQVEQQSSRTAAAGSHPPAISITGMSPQIATPDGTITVRGTLANHTGSTVSGITLRAVTGAGPFETRSG